MALVSKRVKILNIYNAAQFSCIVYDNDIPFDIYGLLSTINNTSYNKADENSIEENQFYIHKSNEDQIFRRCIFSDIGSKSLYFIDEGYFCHFENDELYEYPQDFYVIGFKYMNCVLSNIVPVSLSTDDYLNYVTEISYEWDVSAKGFVSKMLKDQICHILINNIDQNYVFHVTLAISDGDKQINLNDILISNSYAKKSNKTIYKISTFKSFKDKKIPLKLDTKTSKHACVLDKVHDTLNPIKNKLNNFKNINFLNIYEQINLQNSLENNNHMINNVHKTYEMSRAVSENAKILEEMKSWTPRTLETNDQNFNNKTNFNENNVINNNLKRNNNKNDFNNSNLNFENNRNISGLNKNDWRPKPTASDALNDAENVDNSPLNNSYIKNNESLNNLNNINNKSKFNTNLSNNNSNNYDKSNFNKNKNFEMRMSNNSETESPMINDNSRNFNPRSLPTNTYEGRDIDNNPTITENLRNKSSWAPKNNNRQNSSWHDNNSNNSKNFKNSAFSSNINNNTNFKKNNLSEKNFPNNTDNNWSPKISDNSRNLSANHGLVNHEIDRHFVTTKNENTMTSEDVFENPPKHFSKNKNWNPKNRGAPNHNSQPSNRNEVSFNKSFNDNDINNNLYIKNDNILNKSINNFNPNQSNILAKDNEISYIQPIGKPMDTFETSENFEDFPAMTKCDNFLDSTSNIGTRINNIISQDLVSKNIVAQVNGIYEVNECSNSNENSPELEISESYIKTDLISSKKNITSIEAIERWSKTHLGVPAVNNGFDDAGIPLPPVEPLPEVASRMRKSRDSSMSRNNNSNKSKWVPKSNMDNNRQQNYRQNQEKPNWDSQKTQNNPNANQSGWSNGNNEVSSDIDISSNNMGNKQSVSRSQDKPNWNSQQNNEIPPDVDMPICNGSNQQSNNGSQQEKSNWNHKKSQNNMNANKSGWALNNKISDENMKSSNVNNRESHQERSNWNPQKSQNNMDSNKSGWAPNSNKELVSDVNMQSSSMDNRESNNVSRQERSNWNPQKSQNNINQNKSGWAPNSNKEVSNVNVQSSSIDNRDSNNVSRQKRSNWNPQKTQNMNLNKSRWVPNSNKELLSDVNIQSSSMNNLQEESKWNPQQSKNNLNTNKSGWAPNNDKDLSNENRQYNTMNNRQSDNVSRQEKSHWNPQQNQNNRNANKSDWVSRNNNQESQDDIKISSSNMDDRKSNNISYTDNFNVSLQQNTNRSGWEPNKRYEKLNDSNMKPNNISSQERSNWNRQQNQNNRNANNSEWAPNKKNELSNDINMSSNNSGNRKSNHVSRQEKSNCNQKQNKGDVVLNKTDIDSELNEISNDVKNMSFNGTNNEKSDYKSMQQKSNWNPQQNQNNRSVNQSGWDSKNIQKTKKFQNSNISNQNLNIDSKEIEGFTESQKIKVNNANKSDLTSKNYDQFDKYDNKIFNQQQQYHEPNLQQNNKNYQPDWHSTNTEQTIINSSNDYNKQNQNDNFKKSDWTQNKNESLNDNSFQNLNKFNNKQCFINNNEHNYLIHQQNQYSANQNRSEWSARNTRESSINNIQNLKNFCDKQQKFNSKQENTVSNQTSINAKINKSEWAPKKNNLSINDDYKCFSKVNNPQYDYNSGRENISSRQFSNDINSTIPVDSSLSISSKINTSKSYTCGGLGKLYGNQNINAESNISSYGACKTDENYQNNSSKFNYSFNPNESCWENQTDKIPNNLSNAFKSDFNKKSTGWSSNSNNSTIKAQNDNTKSLNYDKSQYNNDTISFTEKSKLNSRNLIKSEKFDSSSNSKIMYGSKGQLSNIDNNFKDLNIDRSYIPYRETSNVNKNGWKPSENISTRKATSYAEYDQSQKQANCKSKLNTFNNNSEIEKNVPTENMRSISRNSVVNDNISNNKLPAVDEWNNSQKSSSINVSNPLNINSFDKPSSWCPRNVKKNASTSNQFANELTNQRIGNFPNEKSGWNCNYLKNQNSQNMLNIQCESLVNSTNNQESNEDNFKVREFHNKTYNDINKVGQSAFVERTENSFKYNTQTKNRSWNPKGQPIFESNKKNFNDTKDSSNNDFQCSIKNGRNLKTDKHSNNHNISNKFKCESENEFVINDSASVYLDPGSQPNNTQLNQNFTNETQSMISLNYEGKPWDRSLQNNQNISSNYRNNRQKNYDNSEFLFDDKYINSDYISNKNKIEDRRLNFIENDSTNIVLIPDRSLPTGPSKPFKLKNTNSIPPIEDKRNNVILPTSIEEQNIQLIHDEDIPQLEDHSSKKTSQNLISLNKTILFEPPELCNLKINSISELRIPKNIKYTIDTLGITQPSLIMKYAWNLLVKKTFSLLITPKHSGLTTLAITYMLYSFYDIIITYEKVNPMVLIICDSWENVESTYELISCFKFHHKSLKIHKCYPGILQCKDSIHQLVQGCDILITTVSSAIEAHTRHYISFDDVKCVIVDNISEILDTHYKKFRHLLSFVHASESITFMSHFWNRKIPNLINQQLNLIITDPIEIASYKRIDFQIKLCYEIDNFTQLKEITQSVEKCIVTVGSALEADNTVQMLSLHGIVAIKVTEFLPPDELASIKNVWSRSSNLTLVISDNAIKNIKINDSDTLISTVFPSSREVFRSRMSLLSNSIIDGHKCFFMIMVNEKSLENLHVLVHHFKKMTGNVDFIDQDILHRSLMLRDEKYSELCDSVKLFGSCYNYLSCKTNHNMIFSSNNWPSHGQLRMKIVFVKSSTHLFCRVLEHFDNDVMTKCDTDFTTISTNFQIDMINPNRLSTPITKEFISSKSLISLKDDYGVYHRCYIVSIDSYNEKVPAPKVFSAYCIDLGVNVKVDYTQLYEIPEQYKTIKPLVAEVIFVGIKPKNKEKSWSIAIDQLVRPHLMDKIITASVVFSGDNTIWVNQIFVSQNLSTLSSEMISFNLKQFMLDHQLASVNLSHEKHFSNQTKPVISVDEIVPKFQSINIGEKYDVVVTNILSDGRIFIILKDVEFYIEKYNSIINEKILNIPNLLNIDLNTKCLVEYQQKWCRGLIINTNDISSEVFLLDLGQFIQAQNSSLKIITDELIKIIPFQSIECRLYGHDSKDFLSFDKLDDVSNILIGNNFYLTPVKTIISKIIQEIPSFAVKLVKQNDDSDLCLSQYLFFNCLIRPDSDMLNDLFPASGNCSKPWNYLIHSFFTLNDHSACDKMQLFVDCVDQEDKTSLLCDIDLIQKWLEISNTVSNIEETRIPVVDISSIKELSDIKEDKVDPENCNLTPPRTNWSQTDSSVYIIIPISKQCQPNITIAEQSLIVMYSFDISYGFKINLFDKIDISLSRYDVNESRIRIILHKMQFGYDWDNLTSVNIRNPWLKYDWDYNPQPTVSPWEIVREVCPSSPKRPSIVKKVVVEPEEAPGLSEEQVFDDALSLPSDCYSDFVCSE